MISTQNIDLSIKYPDVIWRLGAIFNLKRFRLLSLTSKTIVLYLRGVTVKISEPVNRRAFGLHAKIPRHRDLYTVTQICLWTSNELSVKTKIYRIRPPSHVLFNFVQL